MDRIPYHLLDGVALAVGFEDFGSADNVLGFGPTATTTAAADLALANNEANDYWAAGYLDPGNFGVVYWKVTLPEPYDIHSYYGAVVGDSNSDVNQNEVWYRQGGGGVWTRWVNYGGLWPVDVPTSWETGIVTPASPLTNVVEMAMIGMQDQNSYGMRAFHLYGQPTTPTDRLRLWDPSLDQAHAGLDLGSVNPGEVKTVQFRIKNTSAADSAAGVTLSASDLTGDMADGVAFSADGSTFTPTLDIGALASGAISSVLYARRTVGANPTFGHQQAYLSVVPTSWS